MEHRNDSNTELEKTEAAPTPLLEYVSHPARRNRTVTLLVTIFILICLILVWLNSYSIMLTGLGVLILIGSLAGFYFPTRYIFYDDHFLVKTTLQTLRKEWSLYRSFYPDKNGILLSPFARPTRMDNFRGIFTASSAMITRIFPPRNGSFWRKSPRKWLPGG